MGKKIELLDCTLRDGAYIVNAKFGVPAIKGIIKKLAEANVNIIECGWLKDAPHKRGTSFYHVPSDLEQYLGAKKPEVTYVAMIDWDRYDVENLPVCDGKSIDAIRVVFPHGKHREGIAVGRKIRAKGYQVYFQAANTLAYSDAELRELARAMNDFVPTSLSVVDTFGAMYEEDLERIAGILDAELLPEIRMGFHSHNNQQLSFSLTMHFTEILAKSGRDLMVDASLCGMGRGAGNATTELVANFLDLKKHGNYDLNVILDAIDTYMCQFQEKYKWGYSTPYFIAGMYGCHVNNIAYLQRNHRTNARDMKNVIESLSVEERRKYDYDLLEQKYMENQGRMVDDEAAMQALKKELAGRAILLIAPGISSDTQQERIESHIRERNPVVIGVNAVNPKYAYDYLFFINTIRYEYARDVYADRFASAKRILLSGIKTVGDAGEYIVNFSGVMKRGWEHFDNAVIDCLRLMDRLEIKKVALAGFDTFQDAYNKSYADQSLPTVNPDNDWDRLNREIAEMFLDFRLSALHTKEIEFVTPGGFEQ